MARHNARIRGARPASRRPRISPARLDALIQEAIVDAYSESEQAIGFHATIEQHLALPFEAIVLGVAVTVKKVERCRGWSHRRDLPSRARATGHSDSRAATTGSAPVRLGVDRGLSPMEQGPVVGEARADE